MTTLDRFIDNKFSISGISVLRELDGCTFDQLAPRDQRRLENRTIRCIVITDESHPDIKFDVFERLNTGAASLTSQELRNCIYRGRLNDSLKDMAEFEDFVRLMGGSSNLRMEHEELVLRFLALVEGVAAYKPPLRQFLNAYMRRHRNATPSKELQALFNSTCEAVYETLGDTAFKIAGKDGRYHRIVNKALFDSIMVSVAFADRVVLKRNAHAFRDARDTLLADEEFLTSIGRATADRVRMVSRVQKFADALEQAGVPVALPDLSD